MPWIVNIAAGLLLAAAAPSGEPPSRVAVAGPLLRLGDVVDVATVPAPLRARAAAIAIARTPEAGGPTLVTRTFLIRRVRSHLPLLGDWAQANVTRDVVVSRVSRLATPQKACLRATQDVAEGAVLRSEHFDVVGCPAKARRSPFRYAAAERAVRAAEPIAAGEVLPRFAGYGVTMAHAGDKVTLLAVSGPVTVTREAQALQSVRENQRTLVQTSDGQALSVTYQGAAQ